MKKCPFCAEEIQDEAIKCRYCGEMLGALPGNVVGSLEHLFGWLRRGDAYGVGGNFGQPTLNQSQGLPLGSEQRREVP